MLAEREVITVVAATQNQHKLQEIKAIVESYGMNVLSQKDAGLSDVDVEEDGDTFEANSYKKAAEIMKLSGNVAIADDSGLCVDALNGDPGVFSSRFAGEHKDDRDNNEKLFALMKNETNRHAKFVSVITMVYPDGKTLTARGECPGVIIDELRGSGGFGYDPLFIPDGYDETFGELSSETKNSISHRAQALKKLKELLEP